jgi:hypothetical protein
MDLSTCMMTMVGVGHELRLRLTFPDPLYRPQQQTLRDAVLRGVLLCS